MTSLFGYRVNPLTEEDELHNGVDIAVPEGTPVRAMKDGVVRCVDEDALSGVYLQYDTADGFMVTYAHLSLTLAEEGEAVRQGQVIAESGNTGLSTGPHVHVTLRMNGQLVNPLDHVGLTAISAVDDS